MFFGLGYGKPEKDLYFRFPRGKIQKKIDRKLEDP